MAVTAGKIGRNDPCPCGSGRKFKQCCGLTRSTAPAPVPIQTLLANAAALQSAGRLDEAQQTLDEALRREPHNRYALYMRGLLHHQRGRSAEGAALMARAFAAGLKDPAAHFHYARVLLALSQIDDTIRQLQAAVAGKPDFTDALNLLGNVLHETGNQAEAEAAYRRSIAVNPRDWSPHFNLAHALYFQDRHDDAFDALDAAIGLAPAEASIHASKAMLLESAHRLDEARASANRALELEPGQPGALLMLAKLHDRERDPEAALQVLDRIDEPRSPPQQQAALWNQRGHSLDRLGRFDEAFAAFSRARAIEAGFRRERFDAAASEARMAQAVTDVRSKKFPELEREDLPFQPVFVLGFHRSGTSLVEQILASHGDIVGAGELPTMTTISNEMTSPAAAFRRSILSASADEVRAQLRAARTRYLDEARRLPTVWRGERWIVDKHPFNSRHLDLIHRLFPGAPVIRVLRHPLDVILSCYFQFFREANAWASTFENAATYFAMIDDHIEAMRAAVPLNYREIRYEDLIAAPEATIRAMLAFVGAEFDPACLNFHENKRVVRTASYEQVTRKLYSSSAGRYRHYLPFIDHAAIDRLGRAMARAGYAVER